MSQSSDVRVTSTPVAPAIGRSFLRRVCTNNPFYVLSAGLFLFGLRVSFGGQTGAAQTWSLMGGLVAYTLLLAGTASLLVRFGNVWDDVRTVLLLVVLMFLATSVTFDEVLYLNPIRGFACYLGGLLVAVAVSEGLLRGIRLRLPALFRVPYYLALGLFFLYPLALNGLKNSPREEALQWGLYGFSAAAGLVALTLLPAIRRGPAYTAANGSPWSWPLYPWVLFGLLGAAVPARAFLLCWSMHGLVSDERARMIFQPYFVAPFGIAVAALLLELGIVSSRRGALRAALIVPALAVCLTLIGHGAEPIQGFRAIFAERLRGDPLKLTLLASACFYGYAALRRVHFATEALSAALVAVAMAGPNAMGTHLPGIPEVAALLIAAALQLAIGLWRRDGLRCLLGSAGMAAGIAWALPGAKDGGSFQWLMAYHLELVSLLALGAVFDDRFGKSLRAAGALLVLLACLVATFGRFEPASHIPAWFVQAYPPVMVAIFTSYCLLLGHHRSLAAAVIAGACWVAEAGWYGYYLLHTVVPGLNHIALSLALFAIAVIVSLGKAGILSRLLAVWMGTVPAMARLQVLAEHPGGLPDSSGADRFSADP